MTEFAAHQRLRLEFHDVIDECADRVAPARHHVEELLAFGRDALGSARAHLLVHCHAGISRSTAALALVLCQAWPERAPADALN